MRKPVGFNLLLNCRDQVRESCGHDPRTGNQWLWVGVHVGRQTEPMPEADVAEAVFASDLHCEVGLADIDALVWHVHIAWKAYPEGPYLPTLVAKGVTGVRNMGAPPELIAQRRREIAESKLVGLRIITRDRTGRLGVEHCRITRASRPSTGGG